MGYAVRIGVVLCVVVAAFVGAARLDDTIAVFDFRADLNDALTYRDRTYLASDLAGDWRVIEDGRLWMPETATYRVLQGEGPVDSEHLRHARYFLLGLLLPRRQTDSSSAPWVFCYGCEAGELRPKYRVLSDSGDGFVFGALAP